MKRIFISSTVYDLVDIRAEIGQLVRSLDLTPVMSDDKLSDFKIQFNANSIESCLVNLRSCDEVVFILDKRYGPRLGKVGFDNISATHLEYRCARENNKPIHFYVRDKLEADLSIWKKNSKDIDNIDLNWIQKKDDGLFEFIEEHRKLNDSSVNNWYNIFSTSLDLKESLRKYFEKSNRPKKLIKAIYENHFPLFNVGLNVSHQNIHSSPVLYFRSEVTNIGGATAFNFQLYWKDKKDEPIEAAIMAPNQNELMCFYYTLGAENSVSKRMIIEYQSPIGISVTDEFQVSARVIPSGDIISGSKLIERKFQESNDILLNVSEITGK